MSSAHSTYVLDRNDSLQHAGNDPSSAPTLVTLGTADVSEEDQYEYDSDGGAAASYSEDSGQGSII